MLHISDTFRNALNADDRVYIEKAIITTKNASGTSVTLTLREDKIWNSGFSIDTAVSSDSSFELGGGIIGKATLVINNISGEYSEYDFTNAPVQLFVGLASIGYDLNGVEHNREWLAKGVYTVDEATYAGEIITLSCLDNMHKLDKDYSTVHTIYSANLQRIVIDICNVCGIPLYNNTIEFPHWDAQVSSRPDDEGITCREMITHVAQAVGCFAFCDGEGRLVIKDFSFQGIHRVENQQGRLIPVATDNNNVPVGEEGFDPLDYDPWDQQCHLITGTYSSTIGVDDVVITGVSVTNEIGDDEITVLAGDIGYVIGIQNNPLIQSQTGGANDLTMQNVANWVGFNEDSADTHYLISRRFRVASLSHLSDPTIEPGDVAYVRTRKGVYHPILISSTTFTAHSSQSTRSSAETPARNSATRYSAETQTYIALRRLIEHEKTQREQAIDDLNDRLVTMPNGAYNTTVNLPSGGSVYYVHDHQDLEQSETVWKITADAWGVATGENVDITKVVDPVTGAISYTDDSNYNNGMDAFGNAILSKIYAHGIIADYIDLYGDMVVYQDSTLNNTGGKLGFGLGQSYWGQTNGIHLLSLNELAEVIATTSGARISYYNANDSTAPSNAVMALPFSTQMHTHSNINSTEYDAYITTFEELRDVGTSSQRRVTGASMSAGTPNVSSGKSTVMCDTSEAYIKREWANLGFYDDYIVGTNNNSAYMKHSSGISGSNAYEEDYITLTSSGILSVSNTENIMRTISETTNNGPVYDRYITVVAPQGTDNGAVRLQFNNNIWISMFYNGWDNDQQKYSGGIKFGAGVSTTSYTAWLSVSDGWGSSSDRRLKHDITYDVDPDIVDKLKPARFKMNGSESPMYGFIAQDVQDVAPEVVMMDPDGEYLGLRYNDFSALLVAKVQKQQEIIDNQQETIDKQQKKIEELESRLTKIEELLNTTK